MRRDLLCGLLMVQLLVCINYYSYIIHYSSRLSTWITPSSSLSLPSYNNRITSKQSSGSESPVAPSMGDALQQLPYCTSISPTLAHALLYYREHIQEPMLHSSSISDNTRWLYFQTVKRGANGGLADRLKGLVNTFIMAMLTKRAFGIDWQYPVPIDHFYQHNILEWPTSLPMMAPQTLIESLGQSSSQTASFNWIDHTPDVAALMAMNHTLITVRANLNRFDSLWNNNDVSQRLIQLGFDRALHLDTYYSCLLQYLIRPSYDMQRLVTHQLSRVAPHQRLICAQIRLGSGGGAEHGWRDSRSFGTLDTARQLIFGTLRDMITSWCKEHPCSNDNNNSVATTTGSSSSNSNDDSGDSYRIYITTDSALLAKELRTHFGSKRLIYTPGRIVHIDHVQAGTSDDDIKAAIKVAADNWLLGHCNEAVISESGFGGSGIWRTRIAHNHIKVLTLATDPPSIVDYEHRIDGDF
jgi:hypothetical protein